MNKILENIYGSKEYNDMQKRLYEEEQKNIFNNIGKPISKLLVNKLIKGNMRDYAMKEVQKSGNILSSLINADPRNTNVPPSKYWGEILKGNISSPLNEIKLRNINLGKGFSLDAQKDKFNITKQF